jgi:flagellar biosynthesis GTPase FlhF
MLNLKHFQQLAQDREDSLRLLQKPSMRGIRAGIVEKYSEKAHFIYELLQNADDVAASEVRFLLRKNGLYFIHNGKYHFTVSAPDDTENIGHINAITAIGDSTKSAVNPSPLREVGRGIGKFGIGFKAVFQYTNTPHIYDPHISFKIRDLIVPVLLEHEAHPLRKADETLFYFPFDRSEKTPQEAVEEIEDKLKSLQKPLLFLNHLKKITWESENGTKGSFSFNAVRILNPDSVGGIKTETHVQTIGKKTISSDILRFSKAFLNEKHGGNVQIVFILENETHIDFHKKYPAHCFFPTKVMTGFRFLVHAPFLLSDSREGIKQKDRWNESMVLHLAELLADTVETLTGFNDTNADRVLNPVSVPQPINQESLFQALPYDKHDLDPLFAPLADAVLQRLHQKPLLPTADFLTKVTIKNAYLAENKATQNLLGATGLNPLYPNAHWIFPDVTPNSKFFHTIKTFLTANKNVVTYDFLQQHLHKIEKTEISTASSSSEKIEDGLILGNIVLIYDTLSDDERLALMQSVEPNATYAVWDEIEDFDMEGLSDFLDNEMSLEKSLFLWNYLAQSFENQTLNKNNLYGKYTFAWQNEETVFFEPFYLKRLKNTAWLFDNQGILQEITPLLKDFLHEKYVKNQALLDYIFQQEEKQIDRFAYLTDDEKRAIEIGKRFLEQGFSTDDLLELRKIKARRGDPRGRPDTNGFPDAKKERTKREKTDDSEDSEHISSEALLKKQQDLRDEMEEELAEKMEQLLEIEQLKQIIQESERYSMAWFKALLRLEYVLAYERQGKERSIQIHFDRIEREEGTNKTILLKRPSRPLPLDIEEANDITIKLQLNNERRNLAVEVVSIKDAGLRAKLKSPEEIADIDFSKIRGATLDMQNTIFVLEELTKAFNELPFEDDYNVCAGLQDDIRFIFGPPGTGKTTYLVQEEIQPAMRSDDELKVLVLTPTNKAADVLVLKSIKAMGENLDWLMRFGTTVEMDIENAGLLRDSTYNIEGQEHFCVVTTITRYPYDGFNNGTFEYKFKNIAWDVIIVDEASMVGVGYMAYLLMSQPQAKFVIGGDPFQIEPVVLAEDWMGENVYSMVRLASFDPVVQRETLYPHPYKVLNLTTQYRSINTIGQLYSHFAYDGILRHHRFQNNQKKIFLPDLPLKDINIIRFPAHKLEILYRPQLLNKSHYHLYSALLTVELIQYIAKNLHQNQPDEKFKIGVICPYKAQSILVDKVLSSLHLSFKNIEIQTGTIHSFQGDECNIVLCLFNPPPNITKSPNAFLNKMNILNVAISRAKDHLILLMPDENTDNIGNLYQINRLQGIIKYYLAGVCQTWQSADIEQIIFNQDDYLYENTFATTHQSVNIYTKPEKKYEIRIEDTAIDVQVLEI